MDLEDTGCRVKHLIRDRDGKYPALFDTILSDAGIEVAFTGIRMPRMKSIMERRIQAAGTLDRPYRTVDYYEITGVRPATVGEYRAWEKRQP
jgi:hypothetical protein